MKILPSQEKLDRVAYRRGERVSIFRAAVAAGVDWALCALVAVPVSAALGVRSAGASSLSTSPACLSTSSSSST